MENRDKKTYPLILYTLSEEVIQHILSAKNSYDALKKLKDLYDSPFLLELIQLSLKIFNLELKGNDPVVMAPHIHSISSPFKLVVI